MIDGDYCTDPDLCQTDIEDAGRTLLVACPPESTLIACAGDEECPTEDGFVECAPHIVLGDDGEQLGDDGSYCASDCFADIPDAGRTLYVSCQSVSALTVCSDDEPCDGDGEICAPHTYEVEPGQWAAAESDYCAAEVNCYTNFQDLGYSYYVACPATSSYQTCEADGDCDE